jgi:site-specific DNA-methyltransferase (adenine-specific)
METIELRQESLPLDTIICGGNCDVLGTFPRECIDLVVTSPPYDNLRTYGGHSWDFYGVAWQLKRVLKVGGVIVWVVNDATIDGSETGTSAEQAAFFRKIGLKQHDTMIYQRVAKFPETTRYYPNFEYMFVFAKVAPKTHNLIADKPNACFGESLGSSTQRKADGTLEESWAMRTGAKVKEFGVRGNVWEIANGFNHSSKDKVAFEHPAIFPEALARDHIRTWSEEGDIVLDPFSGSGTTAKMARELGRRYIGIELNPEYVEISSKRLQQQLLWS